MVRFLNLLSLLLQAGSLLLLVKPIIQARNLYGAKAHQQMDGGTADSSAPDPGIADVLEVFLKEKSNPLLFLILAFSSLVFQAIAECLS